MVNHGRSRGCNTCKARRVKCDGAKPSCVNCQRLRRECEGYERKPVVYRFKPVLGKASTTGKRDPRSAPHHIPLLGPPEADVARTFFLNHFALLGRDLSSSRGFFEVIAPILTKESHDSAVSLAVEALSTRLFRIWRDGKHNIQSPFKPLSKALSRLQIALRHPVESKSPATILATLVLQFDESLSAGYEVRKTSHVHHNGAIALLTHQWTDINRTMYGRHLVCNIVHTEVASAIRDKMCISANVLALLEPDSTPLNPGSKLDIIGISIANLQYALASTSVHNKGPPSLAARDVLQSQLKTTKANLNRWITNVPRHWNPVKMQYNKLCSNKSFSNYDDCDIYPSVQIATIWNQWRCYQLLLLHLWVRFRDLYRTEPQCTAAPSEIGLIEAMSPDVTRSTSLDLVDAICRSVPFFLGNRTDETALSDLEDQSIILPGYHNIAAGDQSFEHYASEFECLSKEDHYRHVIAQGAWQIAGPLHHMLSICSDPHGLYPNNTLRPGQMDWVRLQLDRIKVLLAWEHTALKLQHG